MRSILHQPAFEELPCETAHAASTRLNLGRIHAYGLYPACTAVTRMTNTTADTSAADAERSVTLAIHAGDANRSD